MPFHDRADAGRQLGEAVLKAGYKSPDSVVLALPRGGVPVAAAVAAALGAPLDVILVRKIGVPTHPELAMGAVVDGGEPVIVRNADVITMADVSEADFMRVCDEELAEIEHRRRRYLGKRAAVPVKHRVAIVIDDGIATGATVRAALRATRKREPKKLVLAVPVGPEETLRVMETEADEIICLERYEWFGAVGAYYQDFRQISDEEVSTTLARFGPQPPSTAAP